MGIDWSKELSEQLDFHWNHQFRPRLDTLTDDEYRWEPVEDCWSLRPREDGRLMIDWAYPEPSPPPVTTIAWRLNHLIIGVFAMRNASHFGGPPVDYQTFPYAASAAEALKQIDDAYAHWRDGVRALTHEDLARPCGEAEGPYADYPLSTLVLHINREAIHHGAEILLLRDLYLREPSGSRLAG